MTDNTARLRALVPSDFSDIHAHGLARHDIRQLRERCRRANDGAFAHFDASDRIRTTKGARRLIAKIDAGYGATAWARRAWRDRRGTYASWLVPVVDQESIAVCCLSLRLGVKQRAQLQRWPWITVSKHVLARGHQRLRDADWLAMQSELREAAMHAAVVRVLSMAQGFRQFAIPVPHGLVIGDVGERCLRGRTFIVPPYSRRWGEVLDAWVRFQAHLPPEGMQAIEALALDEQSPALEATVEALARELEPFDFLREEYVPGRDPVGELWDAARRQQN
ncbi:MAG TPA: hypothetical protein VFM30_04510 [Steroidobacteraceae bacterium]|nr:hypothetical protein [Steroidobacteraceae bacterium]